MVKYIVAHSNQHATPSGHNFRMSKTSSFKGLGQHSNFLAIGKEHSSFASSRIAVVSAPYEHTVSYGGGTRRGPRGILAASHYVELYDEELDRELCNEVGIATLAELAFGKKVHEKALSVIRNAVEELLSLGKFVVTLGGEHTISLPLITAHIARYRDMSVLQIDAHSDLRHSYMGSRYNHACVMARVAEIVDPRRIVQVGIRAQSIEEARFIDQKGIHTFYAHELRNGSTSAAGWQREAVNMLTDDVYITFDVDGLDPSIMPSTGTPEPNGLLWAETTALLRMVGTQKRIVGFDVVELAPMRGVPHADLTAAKLTYKIMNYAFSQQYT